MHTPLNLSAALPELLLLIAACLVLVLEARNALAQTRAGTDEPNRADRIALALLAVPALALAFQFGAGPQTAFDGMYRVDAFALTMKLAAVLAMAGTIVYGRQYARDRGMGRGELYSLALLSLLGQFVIISGTNLLVLYLGLELMSLPLYALVASRRTSARSTEAGMKYFVLGALASGFMLYGMSMLYGATGSLDVETISGALAMNPGGKAVLTFATVFIVAGLAFKFGAVPFHMWVPDVYQGAPTVVTLLVAGGSKLAAFALAFRLLGDALGAVAMDWQKMLFVLAALSLAIGNIVAVAQTSFKRMIAYSAISQVGFVLLGMAGAMRNPRAEAIVIDPASQFVDAFGGAMFYVITYVLTTLATLGIVQMLASRDHEFDELPDFKGLARRSPLLAGVMLLMMFSLAGIPPLVGFYAKLNVLESVVAAGHTWIAVFAVLMSLIGAFYYLRIVKLMYFEEPVQRGASGAVTHRGDAAHGAVAHAAGSAQGNPVHGGSTHGGGLAHDGPVHGGLVHAGAAASPAVAVVPAIHVPAEAQSVLAVNAVLVFALGILPGPLMTLCTWAVRQALRVG